MSSFVSLLLNLTAELFAPGTFIFIVSIPLSFTNYLITAVILALLHIIITYFVNRYIYNNQAKLFDKVS